MYVDYPTEKECSFKETFLFDNELKRFFLAEIRLWSSSSELKYKKKYTKFIKLKLGKINYNKNVPLNLTKKKERENNSGAITTKSLINYFYLNHTIKSLLLPATGKLIYSVDKKNDEITFVSFETKWKTNRKGVSNRNYGKIIFDNKSNAIMQFINNIEFKNRIEEKTNNEDEKSIVEYKNQTFEYNFIENTNNKWTLKRFNILVNVSLTFKDKIHELKFSNSLNVFKEHKLKKINNIGLLDLDIPIYKNLPSELIINSNRLLLTEKENKFISKLNTTHNNQ